MRVQEAEDGVPMSRQGKATESLNDTFVRAIKISLPDTAANEDGTGEFAGAPAWDPLEVWRRCVRDVRDDRGEDEEAASG
jgi:hypothetical protein